MHGSWNRDEPVGYKVIFVPFRNGRPSGAPVDFVTGFQADGKTMGRPVGVTVDPEGRGDRRRRPVQHCLAGDACALTSCESDSLPSTRARVLNGVSVIGAREVIVFVTMGDEPACCVGAPARDCPKAARSAIAQESARWRRSCSR